jgi:phosphatidylglycerol---prolipoprotein diacylglyceryl transferase
MMKDPLLLVLPYPRISPILVNIGPFPIRWYALAYIVGLLLGWAYARALSRREQLWGKAAARPDPDRLDDLLVYVAFGVVLGGRIGYVLFYNLPFFLTNPLQIFVVWNGGMSFHGGLTGAAIGAWLYARRFQLPVMRVFDLIAMVAPIGLFLGRLANFIKPELWGRVTDVPWAMVFPGAGPLPRHPSQLYEAALEGVALFVVLQVAARLGGLRRPGLIAGVFLVGYGAARIACEFFREPDPQLGFLFGGATMGMLLSIPVILVGLGFLVVARRGMAAK